MWKPVWRRQRHRVLSKWLVSDRNSKLQVPWARVPAHTWEYIQQKQQAPGSVSTCMCTHMGIHTIEAASSRFRELMACTHMGIHTQLQHTHFKNQVRRNIVNKRCLNFYTDNTDVWIQKKKKKMDNTLDVWIAQSQFSQFNQALRLCQGPLLCKVVHTWSNEGEKSLVTAHWVTPDGGEGFGLERQDV